MDEKQEKYVRDRVQVRVPRWVLQAFKEKAYEDGIQNHNDAMAFALTQVAKKWIEGQAS